MVNSRAKGSAYERRLCKKFSLWTGYKIVRTPASGGILKTGDLCPKEPKHMVSFPFSVEAKNRERWDMTDLIKNVKLKKGIMSWWEQCVDDSLESGKVPLLVFTRNLDEDFIILRSDDADKIKIGDFHHFKFYDDSVNSECLHIGLLKDLFKVEYSYIESVYAE